MFFQYNAALGPPYHILVDTNFINFSIQNKLELVKSMMDCLYAKCKVYVLVAFILKRKRRKDILTFILICIAVPCITDCVLAELEKLGPKYRIALK